MLETRAGETTTNLYTTTYTYQWVDLIGERPPVPMGPWIDDIHCDACFPMSGPIRSLRFSSTNPSTAKSLLISSPLNCAPSPFSSVTYSACAQPPGSMTADIDPFDLGSRGSGP